MIMIININMIAVITVIIVITYYNVISYIHDSLEASIMKRNTEALKTLKRSNLIQP